MLPLCWRLRQPTLFNNRPTIDRNLAQSPPPMWYQGGRLAVARWLCFLGPARWFAAVFFLKRFSFVKVLNRRGSGRIGISAGGWRRKVCTRFAIKVSRLRTRQQMLFVNPSASL